MSKLKISAVSYLNTKPFLYGLERTSVKDKIDLCLDIPSVCAQKLLDKEVDLGLVPVAILPKMEKSYIISDYCIGAVGAVRTVCLLSHRPIETVKRVYLDYHSRTSAQLSQYLLKNYWKITPEILQAPQGYEKNIASDTAALIIGDRVVDFEENFAYQYDLAELWQKHTNYPFVFAVWASHRPISEELQQELNTAFGLGMQHLPAIAHQFNHPSPNFDVYEYYTKYISYNFDAAKRNALCYFLQQIAPKQTKRWQALFRQQATN